MKKYIPIIGTISSGKSTFLKALLGINVLQAGVSTTTKFVCIIQHCKNTHFYQVIPEKKDFLNFVKHGTEITGEENIRKKIEEINKNLDDKTVTKDNIFYMLKTPLKSIDNKNILDNYYFLDIPGLNEYKSSYIDIIFSIITMKDILFEIIIFDATSINSDNIINIINNLEIKNCLRKKDNLFILNKIDKVKNKNEIIENFRKIFYQNFEDEKNKNNRESIFINIYDNYFLPMNSLLYLAETRINEDFSYLLQFEYIIFNEINKSKSDFSFYDYIKKRIDILINPQDNKQPKITLELNSFGDNDNEYFENSIEKFKYIAGIHKIKNSIIENEFKSLYYIYKKKYYIINHSEYYTGIQNFLNTIDNKDIKKLKMDYKINKETNKNNFDYFDENEKKLNLEMFSKFEKVLKDYLKIEVRNKNSSKIGDYLKDIYKNLSQKKLRISFIGNINVGKSTVLNSIIGRNILPTDFVECTYRGVFIRNSDSTEYKLYKMKLIYDVNIKEGFYFEEMKEPYCKGVLNIRNFLKNKNKDKNMDDEDAFYMIVGRLKIFDYIKIHKYFIDKIEFIDLPGTDNQDNEFIKYNYLDQIINISNCCVYVNQPKTVEDQNSVNNIFYRRYNCYDKSNYMDYCLFLINKSDYLDNEDDKEKIKILIYKHISKKEKELKLNDIKVSFFSGKYFNEFLKAYNIYVNGLENETLKTLNEFYLDFNRNLYNAFGIKSLKQYLFNEIGNIEDKFELNLEENIKTKIKNDFMKNLNNAFSNLKYQIYPKDQEKIIEKLYSINQALKTKDFSGTIYSNEFFLQLKKIIINSEIFYIRNLNNKLKEYLIRIKALRENSYNFFIKDIISCLQKITG